MHSHNNNNYYCNADVTSEGHLYTEISEADDKLPEIPVNQVMSTIDVFVL